MDGKSNFSRLSLETAPQASEMYVAEFLMTEKLRKEKSHEKLQDIKRHMKMPNSGQNGAKLLLQNN